MVQTKGDLFQELFCIFIEIIGSLVGMKRFNLTLLLLTGWLSLLAQTAPIVYVSADGSGDFNCDGTDDQVEINQALDLVASDTNFTTVYLKGPATFWINDPIYISSNTILEGDQNSIVKLIDNADWNTRFKSLIMQKGAVFEAFLEDTTNSVRNITIRGFEIDGNRGMQSEPSGNSYYNIIKLQNCFNITVNDMYLHDNLADALNVQSSYYGRDINLAFFNNRVHGSGHDGIYVGLSVNFEVYDNIFTDNRTDAHIRAQDCNHFKVYNNICGNDPDRRNSGGIGVDIQVKGDTPLDDLEIYGNYIYGKGAYHGIWLWQTKKGGELNTHHDVHIHHNVISGNQASGIGIFGFNRTLIENNVIEFNGEGTNRSYTDNVLFGKQSGITFYEGANKKKIEGFETIVQNNIIGNSASYGIENKKPSIHTFVSNYNCIYNNLKGNYKNVSSNTDIYLYPDFASELPVEGGERTSYNYSILSPMWKDAEDSNDFSGDLGGQESWLNFHLKSKDGRWDGGQWVFDSVTSFCINAGNPVSDFANEPSPNANRVNLGAFGNTALASKSDERPDIHGFMTYPNPTTGLITISEEFVGNEYFIYSMTGQLVKKGYFNSRSLDLTALLEGVYLIKVKGYKSSDWRIGKIVKLD